MEEWPDIGEPLEDRYCQEWRWSIPDSAHRDLWWEMHLDETDEFGDERRSLPYRLSIHGPGGLHLNLGRVPAATAIDYSFDERTRTHSWAVLTAYGNWEVAYTEGEHHGFLALHVCPDDDAPHEMPVSCLGIPSALVAELGACLLLPPAAWPHREGWMDRHTLYRIQQSLKGLDSPI